MGTSHISDREKQIIRLISYGFTCREIANQLAISRETVKSHKNSIFRKLDARNAANLIHISHCNGVIETVR